VEDEAKTKAKGLLEKKWTSVLRLQKKLMQLEEENKNLKENSVSAVKRPTNQALPIAPALHVLKGHRGGISCVKFHPLYPLLASGSEDATIKIWDTETGQFERTLKVKKKEQEILIIFVSYLFVRDTPMRSTRWPFPIQELC
jgi:platelet-activating factor acetylhydrolase IB subunit alpha